MEFYSDMCCQCQYQGSLEPRRCGNRIHQYDVILQGGERQPPNMLQMALRFSSAMDARSVQGVHSKDLSVEDRLRKVIKEFHQTDGMLSKWHLDEDRIMAVLGLITGTSGTSRDLIANHLHRFKWSQSALNSELLKKPRWLLTANPRGCASHFKVMLTVTETSQKMFLTLVFHQFHCRTRKSRPSQKAKQRLSPAEWDAWVNFSCVYATVIKEAALLATKPDMEMIHKAFLDMFLGCNIALTLWNDKFSNSLLPSLAFWTRKRNAWGTHRQPLFETPPYLITMDQVRPLISIINGHYPYLSESIKLNGFRQYHIHSNHCRLNSMDSDISVSIMYMVIPCILNQPDSDSSYKITRLIPFHIPGITLMRSKRFSKWSRPDGR